jgi:hypothetical protein
MRTKKGSQPFYKVIMLVCLIVIAPLGASFPPNVILTSSGPNAIGNIQKIFKN